MSNIVICSDGTWNRPEDDLNTDHPTNVLMLARAIDTKTSDSKQHVFYDWGVGSYGSKILGGITGAGIQKNILDCYRYIVQNYNDDDHIYLFGFSRGAYTVRALCGLINNCGIVRRDAAKNIQNAWKIYKSDKDENHPEGKVAEEFRKKYSHKSKQVHFVGVWDTVGALGVPISLMGFFDSNDEFYDTKLGSNVSIGRHAMAIDERREDFTPTLWEQNSSIDLKQIWFAGVHSDVGGSYAPDEGTGARAADAPLNWIIDEAKLANLDIEPYLKASLTDGVNGSKHRSRRHIYRIRKTLVRDLIVEGKPTKIHPSVKARYEKDSNYRPKNLKKLIESIGWDGLNVGT